MGGGGEEVSGGYFGSCCEGIEEGLFGGSDVMESGEFLCGGGKGYGG